MLLRMAPRLLSCKKTSNIHSSLQAAQLELERQRATDNLKKGLEHRPEREELERRMCTTFAILAC